MDRNMNSMGDSSENNIEPAYSNNSSPQRVLIDPALLALDAAAEATAKAPVAPQVPTRAYTLVNGERFLSPEMDVLFQNGIEAGTIPIENSNRLIVDVETTLRIIGAAPVSAQESAVNNGNLAATNNTQMTSGAAASIDNAAASASNSNQIVVNPAATPVLPPAQASSAPTPTATGNNKKGASRDYKSHRNTWDALEPVDYTRHIRNMGRDADGKMMQEFPCAHRNCPDKFNTKDKMRKHLQKKHDISKGNGARDGGDGWLYPDGPQPAPVAMNRPAQNFAGAPQYNQGSQQQYAPPPPAGARYAAFFNAPSPAPQPLAPNYGAMVQHPQQMMNRPAPVNNGASSSGAGMFVAQQYVPPPAQYRQFSPSPPRRPQMGSPMPPARQVATPSISPSVYNDPYQRPRMGPRPAPQQGAMFGRAQFVGGQQGQIYNASPYTAGAQPMGAQPAAQGGVGSLIQRHERMSIPSANNQMAARYSTSNSKPEPSCAPQPVYNIDEDIPNLTLDEKHKFTSMFADMKEFCDRTPVPRFTIEHHTHLRNLNKLLPRKRDGTFSPEPKQSKASREGRLPYPALPGDEYYFEIPIAKIEGGEVIPLVPYLHDPFWRIVRAAHENVRPVLPAVEGEDAPRPLTIDEAVAAAHQNVEAAAEVSVEVNTGLKDGMAPMEVDVGASHKRSRDDFENDGMVEDEDMDLSAQLQREAEQSAKRACLE